MTLLIRPTLEEKERKELLEVVTKQFGKVTKEELWGNRDLTYPILKQEKAYFAHYEFESEPSSIKDLDKNLKLNEDILRFLLIRKD